MVYMFKPVKNNNKLLRDSYTGAIINTDTNGYESYINTRNRLAQGSEKMSTLEQQVDILKNELQTIKNILGKL